MISIIIPCYNEKKYIKKILNKILKLKLNKEVILVDDCSNDGTREIIKSIYLKKIKKIIFHNQNKGKGAAIKSALKKTKGDYIIIQDADLEYYPSDIKKIYNFAKKKNLSIVYGSRVLAKNRYTQNKNFTSLYRVFFNHLLTLISNLMNGQKLTDAHTCYKFFSRNIVKKIILKENDFCFCPEITAKISKLGYEIKEIPIKYKGRTYQDGKKINIMDGLKALIALCRYNF